MPNQKRVTSGVERSNRPSKRLPKWLRLIFGTSLLALSVAIVAAKNLETQPSESPEIPTPAVFTPKPASSAICAVQPPASARITQLTGEDLLKLSAAAPQPTLEKLLQSFGLQVLMSTHISPFPNLDARARLAKVPVMMYHDVLPQKKVFFDTTEAQLRQDFQLIRDSKMTVVSLDQLVTHLRTGLPLPEKPVLLTFDDGYASHYRYVYPLLKEFGYPAVFSIFTGKLDGKVIGRSTVTWNQVREMAADPLVTIASHSVTHPPNLTKIPDSQMQQEVVESKRILEERLGMPIRYFTYPEGYYNDRVAQAVQTAGYQAALTMDKGVDGRFAGESESLLAIARLGASSLPNVIKQAWGGAPMPLWGSGFDFTAPVVQSTVTIDDIPLLLATGGQPKTILADRRYQVPEIVAKTNAVAGVDGAFFSMESIESNVMIGPVYSQNTNQFVPGLSGVNPFIEGRPLVLISPTSVKFVPFNAAQHNTLEGIQAELPDVTDAFVAAARLVKAGEPQPGSSFGNLPRYDEPRQRAFWGINAAGQPVIGITNERVDAVTLGVVLAKAGFWDAVMLDSGASTSMVYKGESLIGFVPRPVPHVVALMPPQTCGANP